MKNKSKKDDKISLDLMKAAEKYQEALLYEFGSLTAASQYHKLYELFRKYIKPGSKVLDWGCGNAHFSYWLSKNNYQVSGFGFEDREYFGWFKDTKYDYKKGSFDSPVLIPFPDNYFDAISSVGVLEHVRETGGSEVASLKEIKRILKPGGLFICYHFPNQYSWIDFLASILPNKHHHIYRYRKNLIKSYVDKAGLELLEVRRYGFLPRTMFGKVKWGLKTSTALKSLWGGLDNILSFVFNPICQNYYFVARKKN